MGIVVVVTVLMVLAVVVNVGVGVVLLVGGGGDGGDGSGGGGCIGCWLIVGHAITITNMGIFFVIQITLNINCTEGSSV